MQYLELFSWGYVERTPASGVVHSSDINYLRRLYVFNRDAIQDYYQGRNFSVRNTHILSRLLEHFPTYLGYDSYRYLEFANDKTKYLAKHFKFTSEIERGIVHPSYFFGNDGEDIIISGYENFDVRSAEQNWRTVNPISVLRHHRDDTKLLLPMGTDDGSPSGLNVVLINIPQLSIKFREFVKDQAVKVQTESGLVLNKNHFVIKYVLSVMMNDVIDHMFMNRLMNRFYGRENTTPKFKHRFRIFEPTNQVDRHIDHILDVITNKRLDFINILRNIELIFKSNASELLALDDFSFTRQLKWAIVSARIDFMIFLLDVAKNKDINRHYLNDWRRLAERLERDHGMFDQFAYTGASAMKEKLYRLKNG